VRGMVTLSALVSWIRVTRIAPAKFRQMTSQMTTRRPTQMTNVSSCFYY
jgi:hypothetical protein